MRIPRIIHRPHHIPLVGNGLEQVDALRRLAARILVATVREFAQLGCSYRENSARIANVPVRSAGRTDPSIRGTKLRVARLMSIIPSNSD
jgi:hypothetical protein